MLTVQVKVAVVLDAGNGAAVAVTDAAKVPAVVSQPEISPVLPLKERPDGRQPRRSANLAEDGALRHQRSAIVIGLRHG